MRLIVIWVWVLWLVIILYVKGSDSKKVASSLEVQSGMRQSSRRDLMLEKFSMDEVVSSIGREDQSTQLGINSWDITFRAMYLVILFQPVIWTTPLAMLSSTFRDLIWFNLISIIISHSGAAFIKWAQWAATRPDMFPEAFCVALSELHANAKTHPFSYTQKLIRAEFSAEVDSLFDSFDCEPIASGSIAQVYRAQYRGRDVAVKVRHPDVAEHINIDFTIMSWVASVIERIPGASWLSLKESLLQFSHTISSQTNLATEGIHLAIFNKNFAAWRHRTRFPIPYLISQSVLVESFEEGVTVAEYTSLYNSQKKRRQRDGILSIPQRLVTWSFSFLQAHKTQDVATFQNTALAHTIVATGEDIYLKMLLADNLMHADFHPGNIMVHPQGEDGGVKTGDARIILVDAGMVARLTKAEQEHFIGLLEAIGEGSGREAAEHVINFSSRQSKYTPKQRAEFIAGMDLFFQESCRGYGRGVNIGVVLRGLLKLVRQHRIAVEANYATLIMNTLCLDGLASQLIPGYNVLDASKALLQYHRRCKLLGTRVGRALFFATLPLARIVKSHHDSRFARNLANGINLHEASFKQNRN